MASNRWQEIETIYHSALERSGSERIAFVREACTGDDALQREVESLLAYETLAAPFIDKHVLQVAAQGLAGDLARSMIGRQLGPYQIQFVLGAGGMGEVYKAKDTRLNRTVAIKVLPRLLSEGADLRQRFEREARAIASLNHPNICALHDIGRQDGIDFLVMEYLEGETLAQRLEKGSLPLKQALQFGVEMASALEDAHSHGIVHRDLKPGNVMLTKAGTKLMDFGLAKLTEVSESKDGGTRTLRSETEEGMIVGTVSYMSPEQAEGKKVDARSDLFSFGAVLYEAVSGQKAFEGDTKMSTLAALLKQEPEPVSQRVPGTPPELERIINRCLRKDPERRFQNMADIKVALEELKEESDTGRLAETPLTRAASRSSALQALWTARRAWVWAGAALVVVAMAYATWSFRGASRKLQAAAEVVPLTSDLGFEVSPSFSPDGNQVAFAWNGEKRNNFDIYLKLVGSSSQVRLTTDPAPDVSPVLSPDGRWIGFIRVSKEHASFIIIPAIGGPERIVADNLSLNGDRKDRWFAWFPDGKWFVTNGLSLLSTETGDTRSLTSPPAKLRADYSPAVSPDGQTVAFSRSTGYSVRDIYLLDLGEDLKPKGEPRRLTSLKGDCYCSAWTPDGREIIFTYIVWGIRDASLWKVPVSGAAEPEQLPFNTGAAFWPTIARSGKRLAYQQWRASSSIRRLSLSGPGVAGGPPERFIASTRGESDARYSPDGKRIAFMSGRSGANGIWVCDADGSNAGKLLSPGNFGGPHWSPDGQRIAFGFNVRDNLDIYLIRASGGKPIRLTTDPAGDWDGSWSRDGKWVYFTSNRTGRLEVWKVLAEGGEAVPVTRNGGETPFESPDGKFMYYFRGGLWKMPVSGGEESQILPSMTNAYCPVNEGIYFIAEPDADRKQSIQFLSFATRKVKTVAPISEGPGSGGPDRGLSVSLDGRSLLYTKGDEVGTDLMLVENFR